MMEDTERQDIFEVFGPVGSGAAARTCAAPGCALEGSYRAPVSRERLNEYHWFCLNHVRVYNATWNYYAGLSDAEMEAHIHSDLVGNRPTWPLGKGQQPTARRSGGIGNQAGAAGLFDDLDDPFGLLKGQGVRPGAPPQPALTPAEKQAFSTLGLDYPVTFEELRTQYKLLVKRHHPDTHGGAKDAEERLKRVNAAYRTLKNKLFA